jgi:precorrin-6B methylase 2
LVHLGAPLNILLIAGFLLLCLAAVYLGMLAVTYRRRLYFLIGKDLKWPVKTVKFEDFDPVFARDAFGPIPERCEVQFLGQGDGVHLGTSDVEAWVLTVMSKRAKNMFEFGTCTGHTSYLWARNSAPDAKVVTLTLAPEQISSYQADGSDAKQSFEHAKEASVYTTFRYTGTDVEGKVTQLYGDSKTFDETPYLGAFDLIFVDGSHALSYVISDTAKAMRMLKPGGMIFWHDYTPLKGRGTIGVYRYLNELSRTLPLVHLNRTTLVAYRSPVN